MATQLGSIDLKSLKTLRDDVSQYFWFNSDSPVPSYGNGVHVTLSPQTTFASNPTGQNILMNTDGISIRNGVLPMMVLDNDSLDFNAINTTSGTYTNIASFGATSTIRNTTNVHSYLQVTSSGVDVYQDDSCVASFGSTTVIGQTGYTNNRANRNILIAPTTFKFRYNTTAVGTIGAKNENNEQVFMKNDFATSIEAPNGTEGGVYIWTDNTMSRTYIYIRVWDKDGNIVDEYEGGSASTSITTSITNITVTSQMSYNTYPLQIQLGGDRLWLQDNNLLNDYSGLGYAELSYYTTDFINVINIDGTEINLGHNNSVDYWGTTDAPSNTVLIGSYLTPPSNSTGVVVVGRYNNRSFSANELAFQVGAGHPMIEGDYPYQYLKDAFSVAKDGNVYMAMEGNEPLATTIAQLGWDALIANDGVYVERVP